MIFINDFRVPFKIPDVEYDKMFKNYVSTDAILELFKSLHFDVGANTSLKVNIVNKIILKIKLKIKNTSTVVGYFGLWAKRE